MKERRIDKHPRVETTNYELLRAKFSEHRLSGEIDWKDSAKLMNSRLLE